MGRYSQDQARILSRPCPVYWQGFRSDTFELQSNGWELAIEFDCLRSDYTLCLHNATMSLFALTNTVHYRMKEMSSLHYDERDLPIFNVQQISPKIEYRHPVNMILPNFQSFDATPTFTEERITCLEDMNIFNVTGNGIREVYIETQADMSVVEHLQAIAEKQKPLQAEIRERNRNRERRKENELIASVIKIA